LPEQSRALLRIHRDAPAVLVHEAEDELRLRLTVLRNRFQPTQSGGVIARLECLDTACEIGI